MTNALLVARKLAALREHLERLRRRRSDAGAVLRADVDRQDALAMSLLVVVQEAIDIAFHIASDETWGLPASYADGFELLAKHAVIDPALAATLSGTAQLRNRVAHGYATVDFDRIWHELPAGIAAFDAFSVAIARHLASAPPDPRD